MFQTRLTRYTLFLPWDGAQSFNQAFARAPLGIPSRCCFLAVPVVQEEFIKRMVLVAYASRFGSTAEVAQTVAQVLNASGITLICEPVRTVRQVERYAAVVLGAPLFVGRLHKDARRFLAANRAVLAKIPVALFVCGPVNNDEKDWIEAEQQLDAELAKFPWLSPLARKIFGGKYDPSVLQFPLTLIPALKRMPASDVRDWTAIRSWASELALKLRSRLRE